MRKILVNENLPVRLAYAIQDLGIECQHLSHVGLLGENDRTIWNYAIRERFAVLTKDSDYIDLTVATQDGKAIIVKTGNLRVAPLIKHVIAKAQEIEDFMASDDRVVLI